LAKITWSWNSGMPPSNGSSSRLTNAHGSLAGSRPRGDKCGCDVRVGDPSRPNSPERRTWRSRLPSAALRVRARSAPRRTARTGVTPTVSAVRAAWTPSARARPAGRSPARAGGADVRPIPAARLRRHPAARVRPRRPAQTRLPITAQGQSPVATPHAADRRFSATHLLVPNQAPPPQNAENPGDYAATPPSAYDCAVPAPSTLARLLAELAALPSDQRAAIAALLAPSSALTAPAPFDDRAPSDRDHEEGATR
jgi:hypothetical protein